MIDKINTSHLQDALANAVAKQTRNTDQDPGRTADASLQADYTALIKEASTVWNQDEVRLQKAKELLNSGQLDSPENIRQAAQNIAQFDI